jgi:ferritin-like metal-binding protein YciE
MKDLWSANDQMTKVVKVMADKAHDAKLKQALGKSLTEITKHAETLRSLLSGASVTVEKEHCKDMEGLAKEATKHVTLDAAKPGTL